MTAVRLAVIRHARTPLDTVSAIVALLPRDALDDLSAMTGLREEVRAVIRRQSEIRARPGSLS